MKITWRSHRLRHVNATNVRSYEAGQDKKLMNKGDNQSG